MAGAPALDAVIVGAGHNGLTCAFYLARRGLKVAVLEAGPTVGGAAVTDEFLPGFRNSAASYTVGLLQPKIIRDMELERHGLEVVLRRTDNFLPGDGDYLLSHRGGLTRAEMVRHHARDGEGHDRFLAELRTVVPLARKWLLRAPPDIAAGPGGWPALLSLGRDLAGLSAAEARTVHAFATRSAGELLDAHFQGDLAKALFGFDSLVGHFGSPYSPGSAYVLLHHLIGEAAGVAGAWGHALGGMGSITRAMAAACRSVGVDIRLDSPVDELIVARGRAAGVVARGQAWRARTVAAAINPRLLFGRLVPAGAVAPEVERHMAGWAGESAVLRINVALDRLPSFAVLPGPGDHLSGGIIIGPSLGYMSRAFHQASLAGWSSQPVIELLIPSTLDPGLAPPGRHVASLFCQHFRYALPGGRSWDEARDEAADLAIATVDAHAPGFAASILGRQILTPLDLERRFGMVGGDIFHGRMSLDQLFSARPMLGAGRYRMPLPGLYLAGAGAHPGGGVSGAPGHNAAHAILADRRALGWPRAVSWGRRRGSASG